MHILTLNSSFKENVALKKTVKIGYDIFLIMFMYKQTAFQVIGQTDHCIFEKKYKFKIGKKLPLFAKNAANDWNSCLSFIFWHV